MNLFDTLREIDQAGDLLRAHPETTWCTVYAESFDQWEEMGGVPADLGTVECLADMALALWRKHKALLDTLEELAP